MTDLPDTPPRRETADDPEAELRDRDSNPNFLIQSQASYR